MTTNDIDAIRKLAAAVDQHDTRAMPNGTERPGEHWNARLIREEAERKALARTVVPALRDEIEQLRAYAETTRYHQQQHAEAVREIEQLRAEREHMELNPTGTVDWLRNRVNELTAELAKVNAAFDDAVAELSERYAERDKLRAQLAAAEPKELTEEPGPEVTEVIDADGDPWIRSPEGWRCSPRGGRGLGDPWRWAGIAATYGPMTVPEVES